MASIHYEDFEIGDVIGVGTVGTIYRVTRRSDGREAALKLLSPAVSTDQQIVRRFEREMMILAKLNHPNIVGYLGDGRHEGQLFYVMELIRGGTLKEVLQQSGPLTWQEAAECGRQIASALQHAHNHGIIHRDLKPGNVFFTVDGQTKLGDFGIARDLRANDLTDAGLTVGTYAYMAPELVRGSRDITGQVDLYALGCVLFEMLTGRTPYVGDNFAAIFDQHLTAEPPRVRAFGVECPVELEKLIVQLLAKNPDDRPFNARTIQGILGELIADMPREESDLRGRDRAASAVKPIQVRLRDRILSGQNARDISWKTLGLVGLGVLAAIVLMFLFGNN
ncbi:MAG: serine/threonine protein kinase [Planctomycetales bacterium]|nr:serine/threonine protein kinase [Planctomycetales bacterium]